MNTLTLLFSTIILTLNVLANPVPVPVASVNIPDFDFGVGY